MEWLGLPGSGVRFGGFAGPVPKCSPLAEGWDDRYGARAFSTLEGYAGRNRETESAFSGVSGSKDQDRKIRVERSGSKDLGTAGERRTATVPVFV
jgi:hypothetical protein